MFYLFFERFWLTFKVLILRGICNTIWELKITVYMYFYVYVILIVSHSIQNLYYMYIYVKIFVRSNLPSFNFILRNWCSFISFGPRGREKCGWCNSAGFVSASFSSLSSGTVSVICCSTRNDFDWFGVDRASLFTFIDLNEWSINHDDLWFFMCENRKWEEKLMK